jgi:hypothetical protein
MNKIPQFSNKLSLQQLQPNSFTNILSLQQYSAKKEERLRNIELSLQQYNSSEQISFQK